MEIKLDLYQAAQFNSAEVSLLSVCQFEVKRQTVFVRVPVGLLIPDSMWTRLAAACTTSNYKLKRTERWPTVSDLEDAVADLTFLWEHWIPRGFLTMIAGKPGSGKSTLAHWFIKTVVLGLPWPDGASQVAARPAVIIESESAQVLLVRHFRDMGIPMDKVYMPGFNGDMLGQPDMNNPEHQQRVRQLCEDKHPALIVLDSVGGASQRGENKIEEVRSMMEFLATCARDFDCSTLAVHHLNKGGEYASEEITVDRVRGSTAITAFTRSLLGVSRHGGDEFILSHVKSNVSELQESFLVTQVITNGRVSGLQFGAVPEVDRAASQLEQSQLWLVQYLQQQAGEVADTGEVIVDGLASGFSRSVLFRAAQKLEQTQLLTRSGYGRTSRWSLQHYNAPSANSEIVS